MCLIILKPAGTSVPVKNIEIAYENNPDGFGAMWRDDKGRLQSLKSHDMTLAGIRKVFADLKDVEAGFHFRWRTHGEIDLANAHPHVVLQGAMLLMHNGTIDISTDDDKSMSDTRHFIRKRLLPLLAEAGTTTMTPDLVKAVGEDITLSNKFLILDASGFTIVNPDYGFFEGGCWYSKTCIVAPPNGDAEPMVQAA